jgi:hypothetical protein
VINGAGNPELCATGLMAAGQPRTTDGQLFACYQRSAEREQMSQSARARSQLFDTAQFETTLHQLLNL